MADLRGRTIVVLEGRLPSELASLVERHGGRPLNAPALREVPIPPDEKIEELIDSVVLGAVELVVFQTGVGARALFAAAEGFGKRAALIDALKRTKVACRGPKPVAVMRTHDIPIGVSAPEPFTSETLIDALALSGWDLQGKVVALQHYGEINTPLRDALRAMGALVVDISLYAWALPADTGPLEAGITALVERRAHAVMFTSQSQVRHLFDVADRMGLKQGLASALRSADVVVAPVGPVCVRALAEEGVKPDVVPEHPKMGPLVLALARFFDDVESARVEPQAVRQISE
ncbi:MAG: uroporphyrinogen-III synthase [Chloroflexi bacterium]|nr:uroporphyrinogen-III synthase [Chloroflexota bacterium]